jgi:predicted acyl esterase
VLPPPAGTLALDQRPCSRATSTWSRTPTTSRSRCCYIAGWYDNFLRGHLDLNEALKSHPDERVRGSHRLILGPWDHEAYLSIRPASAGSASSARPRPAAPRR